MFLATSEEIFRKLGGGVFFACGGGDLWGISHLLNAALNNPECSEKCIRGEYIVKYIGDRKILLTFQDAWIQGKFVDQLSDWLKLIKSRRE